MSNDNSPVGNGWLNEAAIFCDQRGGRRRNDWEWRWKGPLLTSLLFDSLDCWSNEEDEGRWWGGWSRGARVPQLSERERVRWDCVWETKGASLVYWWAEEDERVERKKQGKEGGDAWADLELVGLLGLVLLFLFPCLIHPLSSLLIFQNFQFSQKEHNNIKILILKFISIIIWQ